MRFSSRRSAWLATSFLLVIVLGITLALYRPTLWYLLSLWNNLRVGEYAHGYLVLLISAYMIFINRSRLGQLMPCASPWVTSLVLAVSVLWFLAVMIDIEVVQAVALLGVVFTLVWASCGHRAMILLAFPVLYIGFAVPVWFPLSPILQDVTADAVFWITRLIDIPAFREENMIIVPAGVLSIEEACSGLRYFLAALTLGSLYAYLNYVRLLARIAVVIVVAATAVLANIVRVFIVVYLGYSTDMQHPWVADHLMLGWYVFAALIAVLLFLDTRFYRRDDDVSDTESAVRTASCENGLARLLLVTVLSLSFVATGPLLVRYMHHQAAKNTVSDISLPQARPPWSGPVVSENDWRPKYHGAITSKQDYSKAVASGDRVEVSLYVAYYPYQKQGSEVINVLNRITNAKVWATVYSHAREKQFGQMPVLEQIVEKQRQQRLIWYWYNIGGQVTTNRYKAKLLQLKSLVSVRTEAHMTAVSVAIDDDVEAARQNLRDFISDMELPLDVLDVDEQGQPGR